MSDIISGWFAYILSNNSGTTFVFLLLLIVLFALLWHMQNKPDSFDLRDIICSWDATAQKQVVNTSKSILAGTFIVSSYYVMEHTSDISFGAYLLAWVTNGGIAAWQKTQMQSTLDGGVK